MNLLSVDLCATLPVRTTECVLALTPVTVQQGTLGLDAQLCAPHPVLMGAPACAGTCVSVRQAGVVQAVTQRCVSSPVLMVVAVWVQTPASAPPTTVGHNAWHPCARHPVRTGAGVWMSTNVYVSKGGWELIAR